MDPDHFFRGKPTNLSRTRGMAGDCQNTCIGGNARRYSLMPLTNLTVAEEALSLPPEDRAALAELLIQSLAAAPLWDAEIEAELNRRLENLLSKKDGVLAFHEVFGLPT